MPSSVPSAKTIFDQALELAVPAERRAYLDAACVGAADVRRKVEALLQAHADAGSFLEKPAGAPETLPATSEAAGLRVGPYKLLQPIGEGGMGTVWMAEQTEPVRRFVALKVIKPGMDSTRVIARFEAERQALALMDHPNIARVFDGGTLPSGGRPFFVMELVKGTPLIRYCDEHRLTPRQRLELFVPVCQAVQHAHQKGIIHRDLKPSNVLIAPFDGRPVPKVIDFGVAKAMGQPLTERTLFTEFGAVVGTLEYMSPEQAELNNQDIDTRSDVYSLGVLLYELLTGTTPLSRERLRQTALDELLRLIREEEPLRPSARLSTSKDSLPSISAQRHTEPARLTKLVRGELDWIVMKALEKDRGRRYETASALARDVERYLADEPVEACPPSARYRLKKFARRYKKGLATAAAFVLLLVGGAAVCAWQAVEARRAAAQSRAVLDFFERKVLSAVRPKDAAGGLGNDVSLRAALDVAEPEIAEAFAGHPAAEAEIRFHLAVHYAFLDEHRRAVQQYEQVVALRRELFGLERHTFAALADLALEMTRDGRPKDALPLAEEAFATAKARFGADDFTTLYAMSVLATVHQKAGRLPEAIALFEAGLEGWSKQLGPDKHATLIAVNNLAWAYMEANRRADAIPLYESALQGMKAHLGPRHPSTLLLLFNLAWAYDQAGRLADALPLFDESVKGSESVLGPDHPTTQGRLRGAIQACERGQRWPEVAAFYAKQVAGCRRRLPAGDHGLADPVGNLGICLLKAGKPADAEAPLRELVQIQEKHFPDDWRRFNGMSLLGDSLLGQKQCAEAEPLLMQGYQGMKARQVKMGARDRVCLTDALERLVRLYDAWSRPEPAARWRKELDAARAAAP